jgi:hypothetical protein
MMTTWKEELRSFFARVRPPKPHPTITTLFLSVAGIFIIEDYYQHLNV